VKELLVFGEKTFKIKIPDDAKVTFGPWSPPKDGKWGNTGQHERAGTLRIYSGKGKDEVLAVFAGVMGFRDLSLVYQEKVAQVVGESLWMDDQKGYTREQAVKQTYQWTDPAREPIQLPGPTKAPRKRPVIHKHK
jgi:hypothetical protein